VKHNEQTFEHIVDFVPTSARVAIAERDATMPAQHQ
jgi:hypothetical protein